MNQRSCTRLLLAIIVLITNLPLAAADKTKVSGETWEVEGSMSDACQCAVFCPCEFNSKPTLGHCDDSAILHITKGHFGKVTLDGQRVAVVSQSPDGERLVDTVGKLNFARIYVAEGATDEQMKALAAVVRKIFGTFVNGVDRISADETVQRAKMEVTLEQHRHQVRIPGILDLDIEAVKGGDGKEPMAVTNHTFSAYGFSDPLIAQSNTYTYKDGKVDWDYAGRSASMRTFKMGGEL